jgi:hypothetical protein
LHLVEEEGTLLVREGGKFPEVGLEDEVKIGGENGSRRSSSKFR